MPDRSDYRWGGKPVSRTRLVELIQVERDPGTLGLYIHHRAWQVRWAAINSLGATGTREAEPFLIEVLNENPDPMDWPLANSALGRVGSSAAIPALSRLIHHSNEDAKGSAILALAAIGGAELTPTYLDALTDRSWTAKWAALSAIDQSADDRAIGPVIERLRVILGHDRKIQQGGRTDVMCALSYLNRQAANRDAQAAIDWVRSTKLGRLQPDERRWFEATFEA